MTTARQDLDVFEMFSGCGQLSDQCRNLEKNEVYFFIYKPETMSVLPVDLECPLLGSTVYIAMFVKIHRPLRCSRL